MPRKFSYLFLCLLTIGTIVRAQQPAVQPAPSPAVAPPTVRLDGAEGDLSYRIGPGDILDIRVFGRPEMTKDVRVDNYGRVRLPFLEEMQASCMTESELATVIAEKYKKYLRDPQVDVMVKEFRSQPVAVIGSVSAPGRYQLQRRIRLLELLTFAGGPSNRAGTTIHIIHNSEQNHCAKPAAKPEAAPATATGADDGETSAVAPLLSSLNMKKVLNGNPDANPFIQPGDIISIPEAEQFFVTGSVVKPGAYPIMANMTLTQAVAIAGGINQEASSRVRLVRQEPGKETRSETVYNINDIHRRKVQDVALQPNDIIEVPGSTFRVASRNLLGVSINMLTALPFFIIR